MRTTLSRSAHDGQLVAEVSEVRCCQDLSPCARCLARGDEVGAARRDALIHSVASVRPRRAVLTKRRSGTGYDPGNVARYRRMRRALNLGTTSGLRSEFTPAGRTVSLIPETLARATWAAVIPAIGSTPSSMSSPSTARRCLSVAASTPI